VIILERGSGEAIRALLAERRLPPVVRIEIQSTGCCDSSLGLRADAATGFDLVEEIEGVIFLLDRKLFDFVGEVTISLADNGFVLNSRTPLNEWAGFGACSIKS
jgi:Fe-S cluster assembly iron-binding protein IscA